MSDHSSSEVITHKSFDVATPRGAKLILTDTLSRLPDTEKTDTIDRKLT